MTRTWILLLLVSLPVLSQAPRTVLDGVYTDAQAKRGEAAYGMNCAKCHEGADVDGPPLNGDPFIDRWREDRLSTLFAFIRTNMPRDTPGKLPEADYRDILAFLLQANGYPAGGSDLTAPETVQLVGRDGPKPLPTNALVVAVGCFQSTDANTGTLSRVAALSRTRTADATTPEEMKRSAALPLGTQQFRLQSLSEFKPDSIKGHKVQVKGVLIRQANNDRLNVTSLESLGASCP